MRFHLLFPLAFLSGIHGFALFTPYLLLVLLVGQIIARRRQVEMAPRTEAVEFSGNAVDGRFAVLPSMA